jgi:phosphatidylserine/phosphatidylglycerophosphate/cardiolipin synthase-like enzyme
MSLSLLDVAFTWITGAGQPRFALPFKTPPTRTQRFGEPDGDRVRDSLVLTPAANAELRAPVNGLLWQVPAIGSTPLPDNVLPAWPRLTRIDGTAFDPRKTPASFAEYDLLIEVWPSAFRRLEYIISSLDVPASVADWDLPQMPAPRWFWIRGVGALGSRAQDIVNAQFAGSSITPSLATFTQGKIPIYVNAGDLLTVFTSAVPIEIRAFDSLGAVIDPDWVFQIFDLLGSDSDFTSMRYDWSGGSSPWNAPARHVLTFCDHSGAPYVSQLDPDAEPDVPPARELTIPGTTLAPLPIPNNGVLIINNTDAAYTPLVDALVQLELPGEHQRLTVMPHGTLAKRTRASFGAHSFFRLLVIDFSRWFPTSANLRNDTAGDDAFKRYTDGNEIIPLIDGRNMLREVYRAMRATHVIETYASEDHVPALDPDATIGVPPPDQMAKAKILLTNAWIDADTALLGRRTMNAAPRTQVIDTEQAPSAERIAQSFVVVGALPPAGIEDPAAPSDDLPEYRLWWLLSKSELPPGAYVDVRQLTFANQARGDDPRLPGIEYGEDIYGVLGPLGGSTPTGSGFVGTAGFCVLPALFKNGEIPRANVRVVTWAPDADDPAPATLATSGKGTKRILRSDEVTLAVPTPTDRESPPAFARAGVDPTQAMRLEFDGTPGRAIVVLGANLLTAEVPVVIMNARTGEVIVQRLGPNSAEVRIVVEPFALRDWILVGFGRGSSLDPTDIDAFFMLRATPDQMMAGAALANPTETLGALQESILAGVDTRLLVWKATDKLPEQRIYSATGMVASINAGVNGQRGQSIFDALTRHESGVHHQKAAFIRTARPVEDGGGAMAFIGGVDQVNNRWDTALHDGIEPDRQSRPWHDAHCRVRGRAVWDVYRNVRQRWNAALQHPELVGHDPGWTPLPPISDVVTHGPFVEDDEHVTLQTGDCTAQINRTLAPHLGVYDSFLDPLQGDLSIRKAYRRIIDEARRFLYIEDQYFWDRDISKRIHDTLVQKRIEFVLLVMPKDVNEFESGDLVLYAQRRRSLLTLLYGVPEIPPGTDPKTLPENVSDRVVVFTIANDFAEPVYVHCKTIVADDLWVSISSSNLSRRSMTYDGEIGIMAIDRRCRRGAQRLARDYRVELMAAHLGLVPEERALVEDPYDAFRLVKDYLNGKWPGRHLPIQRSGLAEMDPIHTHYGIQPADADGTFIDAVNVLADPDGTKDDLLPTGLLDIRELMAALSAGTPETPFGGIGVLRVAFDVAALGNPGNPGDIVVEVSIIQTGQPESTRVALGTFPATATVNAGVIKIGVAYSIRARAALAATPNTQIGQLANVDVDPLVEFNTLVTITFQP